MKKPPAKLPIDDDSAGLFARSQLHRCVDVRSVGAESVELIPKRGYAVT
jgi:hypothetical protein